MEQTVDRVMDSDYGYCNKVYDMIRRTGLQDPSQQCDTKFTNQINDEGIPKSTMKKYCCIFVIDIVWNII